MDDVADTADTSPIGTPVKGRRPPPPRRTSSPPPEYGIARAEPIDAGRFEPALHVMSIGPSPFNRKVDTHKLDDLIESIRQHGVINPITVRPTKTLAGIIQYEVVAGERRWRASEPAGRTTIPAIVRELADDQVVEIQLIENARRENLHPLEEADIYARLLALPGYTEDRVAERTGTKLSHVRERLRLTKLTPKVRDLFAAGKLGLEVALLIGRMPAIAELQDKAAEQIAKGEAVHAYDEESGQRIEDRRPLTIREVRDLLRSDYMTRLEQATWKLDDAELVPTVGACSTCPKRTGNQPALFDDVKSPDICTDPPCFRLKSAAHFSRVAETAKARGLNVLADKEVKAVFGDHVNRRGVTAIAYNAKLADVKDELPYSVTKGEAKGPKTWSGLLKGVPDAPPIVIAKDPKTGAPRELIDTAAAIKAATAAGKLKPDRAEPKADPEAARKEREQRAKEKAKEELDRAVRERMLVELAEGKLPAKAELAWWRTFAKLLCNRLDEGVYQVFERRGIDDLDTDKVIDKKLTTVAEVRGLVAEVLVTEAVMYLSRDDEELVDKLAELQGIDRKAHVDAAKKAIAAEEQAAAAAKKKGTGESAPAKAKKGGRRG